MKDRKKPSMLIAVLFTISATCSLMTLLLMVINKTNSEALLIFQVFTTGLLMFCAVANWVVFFKKNVRYEVEKKLTEKVK